MAELNASYRKSKVGYLSIIAQPIATLSEHFYVFLSLDFEAEQQCSFFHASRHSSGTTSAGFQADMSGSRSLADPGGGEGRGSGEEKGGMPFENTKSLLDSHNVLKHCSDWTKHTPHEVQIVIQLF